MSCIDEIKPLGTFGAIANVASKFYSEDYLVLNGDTIFDANFQNLYEKYCETKKDLQLYLKKALKNERYGGYKKRSRDGFLQQEKSQIHIFRCIFLFL